jgi:hypothetical protein
MTELIKNNNKIHEHSPGDISLGCNRCNKPITPEEAVLTPTGYRCKDCVREQQKIYDTTKGLDVLVGFLISALIAYAGSWLARRLGFLVLLVGPGVGMLIANAVRLAVRKRRSKALNRAVLWGSIAGCLPFVIMGILPLIAFGGNLFALPGLLPLVWQVLYSALAISTAYYQLTGIQLG